MTELRGEMRGKYAEDELVEDLLSQGEDWNYLRFQMAQNAITDQRWGANFAQAVSAVVLGKLGGAFPKSVHDDVVAFTENTSKTVNDDTSNTLVESMSDNFSKDFDSMKSAVADMQAQMTDLLSTFSAILGRIEIEAT